MRRLVLECVFGLTLLASILAMLFGAYRLLEQRQAPAPVDVSVGCLLPEGTTVAGMAEFIVGMPEEQIGALADEVSRLLKESGDLTPEDPSVKNLSAGL